MNMYLLNLKGIKEAYINQMDVMLLWIEKHLNFIRPNKRKIIKSMMEDSRFDEKSNEILLVFFSELLLYWGLYDCFKERGHNDDDRHGFLLRHLEGKERLVFEYNDHGRPYLKDYSKIQFNISHANEMCVLVTSNCNCSVDIEFCSGKYQSKKYIEEAGLNKFCLSSKEDGLWQNQSIDFLQFWTWKEAFIKYRGLGLTKEINQLEVIDYECDLLLMDNEKKTLHSISIQEKLRKKTAVSWLGEETHVHMMHYKVNHFSHNYYLTLFNENECEIDLDKSDITDGMVRYLQTMF